MCSQRGLLRGRIYQPADGVVAVFTFIESNDQRALGDDRQNLSGSRDIPLVCASSRSRKNLVSSINEGAATLEEVDAVNQFFSRSTCSKSILFRAALRDRKHTAALTFVSETQ